MKSGSIEFCTAAQLTRTWLQLVQCRYLRPQVSLYQVFAKYKLTDCYCRTDVYDIALSGQDSRNGTSRHRTSLTVLPDEASFHGHWGNKVPKEYKKPEGKRPRDQETKRPRDQETKRPED
ncbi:hypothetical protein BOTCAL_0159g00040 [Botryotinia calthae]|uniref:Uncharacterized protein n=1 Tax=Botryotinia calthae TaxID=38488 RepID=A0A4Y8D1V1_9HELO|nr:hypothetical protein BOTCAL_0159g00040 [Botryotinia calthae]